MPVAAMHDNNTIDHASDARLARRPRRWYRVALSSFTTYLASIVALPLVARTSMEGPPPFNFVSMSLIRRPDGCSTGKPDTSSPPLTTRALKFAWLDDGSS